MLPSLSAKDHRNVGLRHAKCLSHLLYKSSAATLRNVVSPHLPHNRFSKNRICVAVASCVDRERAQSRIDQAKPNGVVDVCLASAVFKITSGIVRFVAVNVVHVHSGGPGADECLGNKRMNISIPLGHVKADPKIACLIGPWLKGKSLLPHGSAIRAGDCPGQAAHVAQVADLIAPFMTDNIGPML